MCKETGSKYCTAQNTHLHREGSKPMLAVKDSPRGPKRRKEFDDRSIWGQRLLSGEQVTDEEECQ